MFPAIFAVETLLNPLISCLRCGQRAKALYLKVKIKPIKSSRTVAVGGGGVGLRRKFENLPKYIQSHGVLDMKAWLKINCLIIL